MSKWQLDEHTLSVAIVSEQMMPPKNNVGNSHVHERGQKDDGHTGNINLFMEQNAALKSDVRRDTTSTTVLL